MPEYERLKDQYELLWDIPNNTGYLELVGIMQFVDQTISANTNYDPSKYPEGKVPSACFKDILKAYSLGVKHSTTITPGTGVDKRRNSRVVMEREGRARSGYEKQKVAEITLNFFNL